MASGISVVAVCTIGEEEEGRGYVEGGGVVGGRGFDLALDGRNQLLKDTPEACAYFWDEREMGSG